MNIDYQNHSISEGVPQYPPQKPKAYGPPLPKYPA